jgi:hypothetical protein
MEQSIKDHHKMPLPRNMDIDTRTNLSSQNAITKKYGYWYTHKPSIYRPKGWENYFINADCFLGWSMEIHAT